MFAFINIYIFLKDPHGSLSEFSSSKEVDSTVDKFSHPQIVDAIVVLETGSKVWAMEIHIQWKLTGDHGSGSHLTTNLIYWKECLGK